MLNAFHARSILELGPKERVKFDSICAYCSCHSVTITPLFVFYIGEGGGEGGGDDGKVADFFYSLS